MVVISSATASANSKTCFKSSNIEKPLGAHRYAILFFLRYTVSYSFSSEVLISSPNLYFTFTLLHRMTLEYFNLLKSVADCFNPILQAYTKGRNLRYSFLNTSSKGCISGIPSSSILVYFRGFTPNSFFTFSSPALESISNILKVFSISSLNTFLSAYLTSATET